MVRFIDDHREKFGVEPICRVLPIAPSVYYEHKLWQRAPGCRPARAQRDEGLCEHVRRVWNENKQVYGPRKVWKQMKREKHTVARCTVERLMRRLGLLRQYFPKGTDLSVHGTTELAAVAFALNTRPRKTLDWKTPAEALDQLLKSAQTVGVARTT